MTLNDSIKNMLNRLQEKVNRILNGSDSLLEQEDYAIAVARFMKLKETFISKVSLPNGDYELKYDLDKGRTILRDLLFLYFYVVTKMKTSTTCFDSYFKTAVKNHQTTYVKNVVGDKVSKNTCVISGSGVANLEKEYAIFYSEEENLVLDVVRDAIVILDMIRNSFGHNDGGEKCYYIEENNLIKIQNNGGFENFDTNVIDQDILKNIKNYLDIEIPFEYIADFGNGIEARDNDMYLMEFADLNSFLIARSLKNSSDVFKKVSVERLNFLYSIVGNDNALLQDLPKIVFSSNVSHSKLKYLFDRCELTDLKKLPVGIFSSRCTIDRIVKIHNLGKTKDEYYNDGSILNKLDVELLCSLPNLIFICSDDNFTKVLEMTDPSLHSYDKLLKVDDIAKIASGIFYDSSDKKRVEFLLSSCKSIDELKNIPSKAFSAHCSDKSLTLLVGVPADLTRLYGLPDEVFLIDCDYEKLDYLMGAERNVEILKELPPQVFSANFSVKGLKLLLRENDIRDLKYVDFTKIKNDDDIKKFSVLWGGFFNIEFIKSVPCYFFENNVSEKIIRLILPYIGRSELPDDLIRNICFSTFSFKNLRFIFSIDDNVQERDIIKVIFDYPELQSKVSQIPRFAFSSKCSLSRLNIIMGEEHEVSNLFHFEPLLLSPTISDDKIKFLLSSNYALNFFKNNDNHVFIKWLISNNVDEERIKLLCGEDLNYTVLYNVPDYIVSGYYSNEKIKFFLDKFGSVLFFKFLPPICFSADVSLVKIEYLYSLCNSLTDFCNISSYLFSSHCSIQRIYSLLSKLNNDFKMLNELPKELFLCDDSMVDSLLDLFLKNNKIKNNMFSHLNDETIALIVYMNALFSVYDKNDVNYALLDYRCLDMKTIDDLFAGKVHIDIVSNMNAVKSLCSLPEKMMKIVDDNKLSFTRKYSVNQLKNMSTSNLLNNFKDWERDFRNFFNHWLLKKLIASSKRTTDNLRNASDHLRFKQLGNGVVGIYDEETKKCSDGSSKNVVSFAARAEIKSFFKSLSLVHKQVVGNDYTSYNNCDECFAHYMDSCGISDNYYTLKSLLSDWVDNYIDETRQLCVSLFYLKNQAGISNVTAVYAGSSGFNLKYDESGAHVCENLSTWYSSLDRDVLDNDIVSIDSSFRR